MSDISPSKIKETPEMKAEMEAASSVGEILAIQHRHAVLQGHAVPDAFDQNVLHEVPNPALKQYAQSVTIDGTQYTATSDTEKGLEDELNRIYRAALTPADAPAAPAGDTPVVAETEQELYARNELELQFKRGELSTRDYINKSGVLKDAIVEHDWEQSTVAFKERHGEAPYSADFLDAMGKAILELGLQDSPSLSSMEQAYQHVLANDPAVAIQNKAIQESQSHADIQRGLGRDASGYFARR